MNTLANHQSEINFQQTYQWTDLVVNALRQSVRTLGFQEIVPALLSSSFEPGAKHSIAVLGEKRLPEIFLSNSQSSVCISGQQHYYLPVSHVVEKQMSLEFMEKIYCLAPCLRLVMDDEDTSKKHLYNFFQFEIEWRTESMQDVFQTGEKILSSAAQNILGNLHNHESLNFLGHGKKHLESLMKKNYPVITFKEALKLIGKNSDHHGDLTADDDYALSQKFDSPFWIYEYPEGVRDSIYHQNATGTYDTYDLMLPFGYGELTTGGIRPKTGEEIIAQSKRLGKNYSADYANWKSKAQIQTAGFGIGLERLLRFISGANSILDFVQYHDKGPNNAIHKTFTDQKRSNN